MPGVKRKERGKTQPVRFEVPQDPEVEKGQVRGHGASSKQGCQMAIARFLDCRLLALRA